MTWWAWCLAWTRQETRVESLVLLVMVVPIWIWLDTELGLGRWVLGFTGYHSGSGGHYYQSPLSELYPWLNWWAFGACLAGCWVLARYPARQSGLGMCLGLGVMMAFIAKELPWALYGMVGWWLRSGHMKYTMMTQRGLELPWLMSLGLGMGLAWMLWKAPNNTAIYRRVSGFYLILGAAAPLMWWWSLRMKDYPEFDWIIDFWGARACGWIVMGLVCLWYASRLKARFWKDAREMIGARRRSCGKCGYDLRGTLAAGRRECPECGERVAGSATTL